MSRITEPEIVHLGLLALEKVPHCVSSVSAHITCLCGEASRPVELPGEACPGFLSGHIPSGSCCLACVTGFVCPIESSCCTFGSSGVLFVSLNGGGSVSPCGTVEKV